MIEKVKAYIHQNRLLENSQQVLLAVSGGADSICMADILLRLSYKCIVLHCNFNLRDAESDADEAYVHSFFKDRCDVRSVSFQTIYYAEKHGISIEMAARDLRYEWFKEMSNQNDYAPVCTAHNKNDNAETFLLNLCRGTGLHGLTGIKAVRDIYRRPLLNCSRAEIEAYCLENNINFRTDSSNLESKYRRNKIRNEIIPLLSAINPRIIESINETIAKLQPTNSIYIEEIERLKQTIIQKNSSSDYIDTSEIKNQVENEYIFFDVLREYNCSMDQAEKIFAGYKEDDTIEFKTKSHIIYKKKNSIEIFDLATITRTPQNLTITSPAEENEYFHCTLLEKDELKTFDINKIYFDYELLKFPLTFRAWKAGDKMKPLGIKGKNKKISDLLTEHKLRPHEKSSKSVLVCEEDILWAIGNKINEKYAVSNNTDKIMSIEFYKSL